MTLISDAEIQKLINEPDRNNVAKIEVLRAEGQLPINKQVGATCGIYALDAAFQIRGLKIAPRKNGDPGLSIRGQAKAMGLSKIGEISAAADMVKLAEAAIGAAGVVDQAAGLGVAAAIKAFYSQQELWNLIVDAVNKGHGIVMPYACAGDDGAPAWSSRNADGFAHWCLLFGYVEYSKGYRRVFMTTYGNYQEVSPVSPSFAVSNQKRENERFLALNGRHLRREK
jgi:hypothetical protein